MSSRPDSDGTPRPSSAFRRAIEANSKEVDLRRLSQQKSTGRVMTFSMLEKVMVETIENLLLRGSVDLLLDRESLQHETREEFRRLLETHQKFLDEKGSQAHDRQMLERQVVALKSELERQREQLEREERLKTIELRLSGAVILEIEACFRRAWKESGASSGPASETMLREMENALDRILRRESMKELPFDEEKHAREVKNLGLRIEKLSQALADAEHALIERHGSVLDDSGVASTFRDVQGLKSDARNYSNKKELLQAVFVNNLRLRRRAVEKVDLEGVRPELLQAIPVTPDKGPESTPAAPMTAPVAPSAGDTAF